MLEETVKVALDRVYSDCIRLTLPLLRIVLCAPVAQMDGAAVSQTGTHLFGRSAASDIVPTYCRVAQRLRESTSLTSTGVSRNGREP